MSTSSGRHGRSTAPADQGVRWWRAGAVVALAVPGVLAFLPAFGVWRGPLAALAGVLLGVGVGALGARFRWGALTTAAVWVLAATLFAGAAALPATTVAGVLPTLDTLRSLAGGVVRSWRDLLTSAAPTGVLGDLLLVPYLSGLVAGVLAVSVALRGRRPAWAVAPPALLLGTGVLFGTAVPLLPWALGGAFVVLAVVWLALTTAGTTRPDLPRAAAGTALVAVALVVGGFAGSPLADLAGNRFVLREQVEPPFDVREFASPLNGYRSYVKEDADTPLFTVSGLPEGSRVRLATMDAYDGTVWDVAGGAAATEASGTFRRMGLGAPAAGDTQVEVEVAGLTGVWLPDAGQVSSITFTGPRAAELTDDFRYNDSTGTGVVPSGLRAGDGYRFTADVVDPAAGRDLDGRAAAVLTQPEPVDVPDVVTSLAGDAAADAQTPYARAQAIAETLRTTGYFSDGLEGQAVSRAGHGAGRIADLLGATVWVGDEEQYAAAAGLMARQLGLPARVVMGFDVPAAGGDGAVVTGDDVTAWIEVALDGVGWVALDVTPDESRIPPEQAPQPAPQPKPATQQPPPPVEQPPPPLPATGDEDGDSQEEDSILDGWLGTALLVAAWVLGPVLLLALVGGVLVGAKLRRRRRRRNRGEPLQRVDGGWREVLDAHRDRGTELPARATRREVAGALERPGPRELAARADAATFAGGVVTDDDATAFWGLVDAELAELSGAGWRDRWRARLSLRSLRRVRP